MPGTVMELGTKRLPVFSIAANSGSDPSIEAGNGISGCSTTSKLISSSPSNRFFNSSKKASGSVPGSRRAFNRAEASLLVAPLSLPPVSTVGVMVFFNCVRKNGSNATISAAMARFFSSAPSKKCMVVWASSSCRGAIALKNLYVVGVIRAGALYWEILDSAWDRRYTALSSDGMDEWPAVP